MAEKSDDEKIIRKLRKKLRQIETLEYSDRELNDEECIKISKKSSIREELIALLKKVQEESIKELEDDGFTVIGPSVEHLDSPEMKRKTDSSCKSESDVKKACLDNEPESIQLHPSTSNSDINNGINKAPEVSNTTDDTPIHTSSLVDNVQVTQSVPSTSFESDKKIESTLDDVLDSEIQSSSRNERTLNAHEARLRENKQTRAKILRSQWKISELEGHEDIVTDCDIDEEKRLCVTASRDTTVKVWDMISCELLQSLRGHSAVVNGTKFLSYDVAGRLSHDTNGHMVVSAGLDCSVKVWHVTSDTSRCLRSHYTYNGVTRLGIMSTYDASVTVTDGGKLEIYKLDSGVCLLSEKIHESAVSALTIVDCEDQILTADKEANLKIFQIKSDKDRKIQLSCIYSSEDVLVGRPRPILSLSYQGYDSKIIIGDSGAHVKEFEWKKGILRKIPNHVSNIGFTDCVRQLENILVASSYNIDTGYGALNLFSHSHVSQGTSYIATLADEDTSRILSLAIACQNDGKLLIVSGGREVKVWRHLEDGISGDLKARTFKFPRVLDSAGSGTESDPSDDEVFPNSSRQSTSSLPHMEKKTGFCNCALM